MGNASQMTRRTFNSSLSTVLLSAVTPIACTSQDGVPSYNELIAETWRHSSSRDKKGAALLVELVRYATLAANSHNTQPWRFKLATDRITIMPDFSRRCPAVDPDDHHLYASLGCATENLVLAAQSYGLNATVLLPKQERDSVRIDLEPASAASSALFQAIPQRQCTRAPFDGTSVPTEQLSTLEALAQDEGVSTQVFTDKKSMEAILEFVVAGNSAQMNDDAFVQELKDWLRFNESSVVEHRDGIFSASSGNPTFPNWVADIVLKFAFTEDGENDKYRDQIRTSAGVIAFVSQRDDPASWVRVGRCYQRFALQATALGVRHSFINQAVEVPEVRAQLAQYLGTVGRRPDLLVRLGHGPLLPRSARRPVSHVVI